MPTPNILLGPIVGGLSHHSANIWARANAPSTLHVWLAKRADLKDAVLAGKVKLTAKDGFAGIVSLAKLKPETVYRYAVSLRAARPAPAKFHSFTTFPKPSTPRSFSFVFGSCYIPMGKDGAFDEIYKRIETDHLRFGLFLGDQIYADQPPNNGLDKIAVTLDDYRSCYTHAWSRPSIQRLLPNLPLFMTLDDHEVDNDWSFDDADRTTSSIPLHEQFLRWLRGVPAEQRQLPMERVRAALKAYQEHQAMHAPAPLLPLQTDSTGHFSFRKEDEGSFAYSFTFGGAAFFVLDTRSQRMKKGRNILLGETQWRFLEQWLLKVKEECPVKFLVSSGTILHPFLIDVVGDRWAGFRSERERLFEFIATNEIEGIHILTGDLHSAHAVSAEIKCPSGRRIPLWEFCSTPFEQTSMSISATYISVFSKWIRNQRKYFHQTGNNYGVVHVNFDEPTPRVSFTLNYDKDGWRSQPEIISK